MTHAHLLLKELDVVLFRLSELISLMLSTTLIQQNQCHKIRDTGTTTRWVSYFGFDLNIFTTLLQVAATASIFFSF
jgi:hypothetical protein